MLTACADWQVAEIAAAAATTAAALAFTPASLTPLVPHMPPVPSKPRPLAPGERVELWLELPSTSPDTAADTTPGDEAGRSGVERDWDVRPAQVVAMTPAAIALRAGSWRLTEADGARAVVRHLRAEGLAEWEGNVGLPAAPGDLARGASVLALPPEATFVIHLPAGGSAGRLHQRRRSPRLAVGLTPIRLRLLEAPAHARSEALDEAARRPPATHSTASPGAPPGGSAEASPEDETTLPVARLTDVSITGAGVVVDYPLSAGTTVALEFDLPGEEAPFTLRGRVVEPASLLHGRAQPQPDGLPGFHRGIEFIGAAANREVRRLAASLARLLPHRASGQC